LTKNATFDQENNAISTPQLLSNKVALGAITSGIGLPSGTGTNMGSADLVGTPLAIGIAADGSFTGPTIGMRHNGIEYIRTGTFLAGFTVGLGGTNFTNSTASGNGTAFPVTMQNLTSGALHAVRITGNVK